MWNGTNWVEASKNSTVSDDVELARGSKDTLWERLEVALNEDGTLKSNQAENLTEWVDSALTATYVSSTKFSVEGDLTDVFVANRKIKATLDASVVYSAIDTSNYDDTGDETTVTLVDDVLNDTLQKIEYGFVKPGDNGSLPKIAETVNADTLDGKHYSDIQGWVQTWIDKNVDTDIPAGSVFWFAAQDPPSSYLECNGAGISRTTYSDLYDVIGSIFGEGDGESTFNIPDLRGEFIRGWDNGRNVDVGRVLGSWQEDVFQGHWHRLRMEYDQSGGGGYRKPLPNHSRYSPKNINDWVRQPISDGVNGTPRISNETRPRNVALLPCIKY
ncbi:hypothetical protein D7D81_16605 [Halocella sp. SP3-1]|nr:hypothetical protein D7D81_16605 [Halocella sp. SP3-1]